MRHGPRVERLEFDDLEAALAELRARAEAVRAEGPLPARSMLREFEPGDQVAARLEISAGGLLRRRDAGVDVRGDGAVVAFAGGVRRRPLEPRGGAGPYDAVAEALREQRA